MDDSQTLPEDFYGHFHALFDLGDTRLFESLDEILKRYVSNQLDVDSAIGELRHSLYEGYVSEDRSKALRSLHTLVKSCSACPKAKGDPHLPHWNVIDPDVVFVTEHPMSGSKYDSVFIELLKNFGFKSSRVCATSVVRCFSEARAPKEMVKECTKRHLFHELMLLQPRVIVPLGKLPTSVFFGDVRLSSKMGQVSYLGPYKFYPLPSPASTFHGEKNQQQLEDGMNTLHKMLYST